MIRTPMSVPLVLLVPSVFGVASYGCGGPNSDVTPSSVGTSMIPGPSDAGMGDSAGDSAGVVPVVQACESLPQEGVWERIGPPPSFQADQTTVPLTLDPVHIGTLYTATAAMSNTPGTGVWKSTDCGATWAHVSTGRNHDVLESGDQWQLQSDPVNSDLYATSGYGGLGLYRSSNGGVDWDVITPTGDGIPNFINGFALDPTDHTHIVVWFHDNCTGAYAPMCFAESKDSAATWRFVVGPSKAWMEGAGITVLGGSTWLYGVPFDALYYTKDSGATWEKLLGYAGCYYDLLHSSGSYYLGCFANNNVQVSMNGHDWTMLMNSPQASSIAFTGTYLYASWYLSMGQPMYRAPLSDLTAWTKVQTPDAMQNGASEQHMLYEPTHRLLYVAAWASGLWRVVTP
jgi:hypothetical protein